MTVKEYSKKVDELIKGLDGKIPGLQLTSDIGVSVTNMNGNPALTFCEVDSQKNPTKLLYCLILDSPQVARKLELWLEDALNIFKMKSLMDSDADIVVTNSDTKPKTE